LDVLLTNYCQTDVKMWWWFGSVGNAIGRINEVNQCWVWLVLGWVTSTSG